MWQSANANLLTLIFAFSPYQDECRIYWLILGNSVGIIDADYYNNPDNEGEIFFQMINLSPFDIQLYKGDIIGQGIIKPYLTTEDDTASGQRVGGFGSTSV